MWVAKAKMKSVAETKKVAETRRSSTDTATTILIISIRRDGNLPKESPSLSENDDDDDDTTDQDIEETKVLRR